eukprot:Awhi_evm1s7533
MAEEAQEGPCVTVEDVSKVYSLFMDEARSTQFLKEYQGQFLYDDQEPLPVDSINEIDMGQA